MKLPRFSLRELFLLVVIAAMGCGWWVRETQLAQTIKKQQSHSDWLIQVTSENGSVWKTWEDGSFSYEGNRVTDANNSLIDELRRESNELRQRLGEPVKEPPNKIRVYLLSPSN